MSRLESPATTILVHEDGTGDDSDCTDVSESAATAREHMPVDVMARMRLNPRIQRREDCSPHTPIGSLSNTAIAQLDTATDPTATAASFSNAPKHGGQAEQHERREPSRSLPSDHPDVQDLTQAFSYAL
jgi:hypothetical protein